MKVDEGLLALQTQEEVAVGVVVHEEVFGEDGGADGVVEEVEGGFLVGVAVGVVGAGALPDRSTPYVAAEKLQAKAASIIHC